MISFILTALSLAHSASAAIEFEGYYRIETKGKHVGFSLQQVAYEAGSKTRTLRFFVKTINADHEDLVLMGRVEQDENYHPRKYEYVVTKEGKTLRESVVFKNGSFEETFTGSVGEKSVRKYSYAPDDFMSSALVNVLLLNHPQQNVVYTFEAIRESEAKALHGRVEMLDAKTVAKRDILQVVDDFEASPVETWVTRDGKVLRTRVLSHQVSSTLVANADLALEDLDFNRSDLIKWFNEIPLGQKNPVSNKEINIEASWFSPIGTYDFNVSKKTEVLHLPRANGSK